MAPALVLAALAACTLAPYYQPLPPNRMHHPQRLRGDVLARNLKPGDLIVCLGLEGAKINYELLRRGLHTPLITYPLATRGHLGWFNQQTVARQPDQLAADAQAIVSRFDHAHGAARRLWVMMDPYSFRKAAPGSMEADYGAISAVLLNTLEARGMNQIGDPTLTQECQGLGILVYE